MAAARLAGSLTTTFIPAPSCLQDVYRFNASKTYFEDSQNKTLQYTNLGPTSTSACVPSGFAPASAYYSPGICPSGYEEACASVITNGNKTETRATCCPLGYTCQTEYLDPWPWYSTEACTIGYFRAGTQTLNITSSISPGSTTTFETVMNSGLNAYGISIRYQAADFATATSTSTSQTSISTSSPPTGSPLYTPQSPPHTPPLSPPTIAGLSLGILVFLSFIAALTFLLLRRYRRARANVAKNESNASLYPHYKAELADEPLNFRQQEAVELGGGYPDVTRELRQELSGDGVKAEM